MFFQQNPALGGTGSACDCFEKVQTLLQLRKTRWILSLPNYKVPPIYSKYSLQDVFFNTYDLLSLQNIKLSVFWRKSGINSPRQRSTNPSPAFVVKNITFHTTESKNDKKIVSAVVWGKSLFSKGFVSALSAVCLRFSSWESCCVLTASLSCSLLAPGRCCVCSPSAS